MHGVMTAHQTWREISRQYIFTSSLIAATQDYVSVAADLTFTGDQTMQCIDIDILDDNVLEVSERFDVHLRVENEPSVLLSPNRTVVSIQDDDST